MSPWSSVLILLAALALAAPVGPQARPMMPRGGAGGSPITLEPGDDPVAKMAEAQLKRGMPLMAAQMADQCLEKRPEAHACREVLGRAAALAGNCTRAFLVLSEVRVSPAWSAQAAVAEGLCHVRTGDLEQALTAFDEAAMLQPAWDEPWLQRGLVNARLGRHADLAVDLATYDDRGGSAANRELLELWQVWALRDGSIDGRLAERRARPAGNSERGLLLHVALLDCYRWLELGDPIEAETAARVGINLSRGHTRLQACRGEATRRSGDPYLAEGLLIRPWDKNRDTPALDAVVVRVFVDEGRLEEAQERLASLPDKLDPDALLSQAYLARATGNEAALAAAKKELAARVPDVEGEIARLVPIVGGR